MKIATFLYRQDKETFFFQGKDAGRLRRRKLETFGKNVLILKNIFVFLSGLPSGPFFLWEAGAGKADGLYT